MQRTELITDMKKFCGGASFITRKQLTAFLGNRDPHTADPYLHGLSRLPGGKHYIPDVADTMMEAYENR